jgi:hypothetical protein
MSWVTDTQHGHADRVSDLLHGGEYASGGAGVRRAHPGKHRAGQRGDRHAYPETIDDEAGDQPEDASAGKHVDGAPPQQAEADDHHRRSDRDDLMARSSSEPMGGPRRREIPGADGYSCHTPSAVMTARASTRPEYCC